jgi:hypothetical protein
MNTSDRRAYRREHNLRTQYHIDSDIYDNMLNEQGGACAICGAQCLTGRRLAVDHDHNTGKVRGLLCFRCNASLGIYEKYKTVLEKYLLDHDKARLAAWRKEQSRIRTNARVKLWRAKRSAALPGQGREENDGAHDPVALERQEDADRTHRGI